MTINRNVFGFRSDNKMSNAIEEYEKYMKQSMHNVEGKRFDRYDVFLELSKNFLIKKAMYPGSYIHITPSLIFPEVIYVDNFKKAKEFFKNKSEILEYVEKKKIYKKKTNIKFEPMDYWDDLPIPKGHNDLLISQYAGFVSQACKKYLRKGGILFANDSHGDATLAKLDTDFDFTGVLEYSKGKYQFTNEDLDQYFTFKRDRPIDIEKVKKTMKGPKYKTTSEYYLFE